jgi:hypothetical protein
LELRKPEGCGTPDSACLFRTGPEEIAALVVVIVTRIIPSASHDTFPLLFVTHKSRTDSGMTLPLFLVTQVIRFIRRPLIFGHPLLLSILEWHG